MYDTGRNLNLHPAFRPRWTDPESIPSVVVSQGNTSFDPLLGTGWDTYLDTLGASEPEGASLGGLPGLPFSPRPSVRGLQSLYGPKGKR